MRNTTRNMTVILGLLFFVFIRPCHSEQILILGNYKKPPKNYLEDSREKVILIEIMDYIDWKIPQGFQYELYPWTRPYRDYRIVHEPGKA
jgi:hypothetical protein